LELAGFIGYLKRNKDTVKLTHQRPKDLHMLSNVDSNYAMNKEDQRNINGALEIPELTGSQRPKNL
jgi:hypothetical protein